MAIAAEARWDMGRGLVSLLLICPKRYGKVLVSQPLPEPGPINGGMYRFAGELIPDCLPLLADSMLDLGLVTSLFFLSFSLSSLVLLSSDLPSNARPTFFSPKAA